MKTRDRLRRRRQRIAEALERGERPSLVASRFGVSRMTVLNVKREFGVTTDWREERRRQLAEMVSEGDDILSVAEMVGCAPQTVRKACEENGVQIPDLREVRARKIAEAVKKGLSVSRAADKFDVSESQVAAACAEHGVSLSVGKDFDWTGAMAYPVIAMLQKRVSQRKIAETLGITSGRVSQIKSLALAAGIRLTNGKK